MLRLVIQTAQLLINSVRPLSQKILYFYGISFIVLAYQQLQREIEICRYEMISQKRTKGAIFWSVGQDYLIKLVRTEKGCNSKFIDFCIESPL